MGEVTTKKMRVEFDGPQPDATELHRGHLLFDSLDLILLGGRVVIVVCVLIMMCTCVRIFRRRRHMLVKKKE